MRMMSLLLLLFSMASYAALLGDSIYQLNSEWQDQHNNKMKLSDLAGKKQLVALIYTDCVTACPVIVADMKKLQDALSEQQQQELEFVLVSLTPSHDTPKVMKHFAKKRELDEHWTLLSGDDSKVRTLAMALNISYMGMPDGEIAHSNAFTVLDEQGRLQLQQNGLPGGTQALIEKIWPN